MAPRARRVSVLLVAMVAAVLGLALVRIGGRKEDVGVEQAGVEQQQQGPVAVAGPALPPAFLGLESRGVVQSVRAHFPGAMPGAAVMSKLFSAVEPYGLRIDNTIYGQSICSDEINGDKGHLTQLLTRRFGKNFNLGGIGGAPYVGKTGFGAFSHHVPDNGHVLIVFGPHIGFTKQGEPGKFLRDGQAQPSTSCGAAIAAYNQLTESHDGHELASDPSDAQQGWLRAHLQRHIREVANSPKPMVELALKTFKAIEEEMLKIINTGYGPGHLVLLGGIQINMPYPLPGYFEPLHFSVRSKSMEPKDLMLAFR